MSFRPLTRKNKALCSEACISLLETQKRGVLSVLGDDGYPYGMPMNHYYDPSEGCLYFHCGRQGHRLDALKRSPKVSFCVMDQGTRQEGDWALTVQSVIVFGSAEVIDDRALVEDVCCKLSLKFTSNEAYIQKEISAFAKETLLIRLIPEHMSGKWVKEA